MGCCISRPQGPNSPYPGAAAASASARAINPAGHAAAVVQAQHHGHSASAGAHESAEAGSSGGRRHRHRHQSNQPLSQHINRPLRRHAWTSRGGKVWTTSALARERAEFFDTRVTGRPEIWAALRAALEELWATGCATTAKASSAAAAAATRAGGAQASDVSGGGCALLAPQQSHTTTQLGDEIMPDDDDDPDASGEEAAALALATAQSILDAAEITLPTGDLANGAYDALGNYYPLPEPIVSDPTNVVRDGAPSIPIGSPGGGNVDDAKVDHLTTTAAEDGDETADEDEDEEEAERRREEKGKAVIDVRDQLSVDARLSGDGRDVVVMISKTDTVRVLARRVLEESGLSHHHKKIRIAYMGKILQETLTLEEQGWKTGHVVNALVFNR